MKGKNVFSIITSTTACTRSSAVYMRHSTQDVVTYISLIVLTSSCTRFIFSQQDSSIGIFAGCCGLIYFHCTLRIFLKLSSCVTGYTRSYQKFHSDPARYISEGYLYFLSHYSRSYQKLFSDDRTQITSLKNVRGSITLKPYRQAYL